MGGDGERVIADGTGVEWRLSRGVVQHRLRGQVDGRPGAWQDTPDVDRIVHPARRAVLDQLLHRTGEQ